MHVNEGRYMRIKSKEIAEELGVSPATVSLALNNRPGVNAETKKRILEYIREKEETFLKETRLTEKSPKGAVMMINYIKNGIIMNRSDENHPVLLEIKRTVQNSGYQFYHRVFLEQAQSLDELLLECRRLDVKGIYIMAAEMRHSDIYPFLKLNIPIVTGDNLFYEEGIDSFLIDNREGIGRAVDYLVDKGHSHIIYLAENIDIFNFIERREAFVLEMAKRECGDASSRIWHLGSDVDTVYESMCHHLDEGLKQTTAFVLESSVVSLGVSKALLERHIRIPRDISLLGFDALPPVSLLGMELTLVKGTHTKRHLAAVKHLLRHIEDENEEIMRVYYKTRLIEGSSVHDKTKYIYT